MAAYRTATRLFPGLHAPVLGMGVEYSQMNNLQARTQGVPYAVAAWDCVRVWGAGVWKVSCTNGRQAGRWLTDGRVSARCVINAA